MIDEPEGLPPAGAPLEVPRDTTPTWELEMLVSGAVIYGLFQLPPLLNHGFDALLPRFAEGMRQLVFVALLLSEATVFALLAAFLVHLVSRTYWVALVGLDSVFPGGVRWERLNRGPLYKDIASTRSLPARISAVDNFCSIIFAVAFMAATMVVFGAVMLLLATAASLFISKAFLGGRSASALPAVLVFLFSFIVGMLIRLDRRYGARLAPDDARTKILRAALRVLQTVTGQALYGPIFNTLMSNVRRRLMMPVLFGLLFLSVAAVGFQRAIAKGEDVLPDTYPVWGETAGGRGIDYHHYADQRSGEAGKALTPFIQSDIIRDAYVRLFIPYVPDRDNRTLAGCPGTAASAATARAAAVLRCLAGLHEVTLDGQTIGDTEYSLYTDPQSGLRGIVTYLSVALLPRGRNVISLTDSPPPSDEPATTGPPQRITIPFWL